MGRVCMGTKIAKIISIVTILSVVCVLFCSCGEKKEPAYFLEAQETSDLVTNETYFELDGNSVKAARDIRYENLIKRTNHYQEINIQTYSFKAVSTNGNPSDYVYTQNTADSMAFDKHTLIKDLRKMGVFWTGEIQLKLYAFDSYVIIEAEHTDGGTVTEFKTGLFRNGKYIEPPKDSDLKSIYKVYKKT